MKNRFKLSTSGRVSSLLVKTVPFILLAGIAAFLTTKQQTGGPGYIISGENTILNPDGGDYMSSLPDDGAWSTTTNEYSEFEEVTQSGGSNLAWIALTDQGAEPSGTNNANDLQAGGACGSTDIVTDSDGGNDYGYYAIIDPDNVPNNGDEVLAVAIRLADEVNGAFTYSFFIDAEGDCDADLNPVCGNPCFEYEVQISTQKSEVNIFNIDGCSGSSDCDALHSPSNEVCNPCNSNAIQVVAGSSECNDNRLTPVFWMAHVNFTDLAGVNPDDNFTLIAATSTSINDIITKGAKVSDFGGIGDPNDANECDCATQCASSSCSDCERDCALACAAGLNNNAFPVEWLDFRGFSNKENVVLQWSTAMEINNDHFQIEQLVDGITAEVLGSVDGKGTTDQVSNYQFFAPHPIGSQAYYRIKQVDIDGKHSYSSVIEINLSPASIVDMRVRPYGDQIEVFVMNDENRTVDLRVMSVSGQMVYQTRKSLTVGNNILNIYPGSLSAGVYILQLYSSQGNVSQSKKFQIR